MGKLIIFLGTLLSAIMFLYFMTTEPVELAKAFFALAMILIGFGALKDREDRGR